MLGICELPASGGNLVEFATLADSQGLVVPYPGFSAVHIVARAIILAED